MPKDLHALSTSHKSSRFEDCGSDNDGSDISAIGSPVGSPKDLLSLITANIDLGLGCVWLLILVLEHVFSESTKPGGPHQSDALMAPFFQTEHHDLLIIRANTAFKPRYRSTSLGSKTVETLSPRQEIP